MQRYGKMVVKHHYWRFFQHQLFFFALNFQKNASGWRDEGESKKKIFTFVNFVHFYLFNLKFHLKRLLLVKICHFFHLNVDPKRRFWFFKFPKVVEKDENFPFRPNFRNRKHFPSRCFISGICIALSGSCVLFLRWLSFYLFLFLFTFRFLF